MYMESHMTSLIHTLNEAVRKVMEYIAFVLLVFLTIGTITGVIFRYVFQSPIVWMYEVVVIIFAWTVFAGVYLAFYYDEQIKLTFMLNAVHKKKRAYLEIAIEIITAVFLMIVIWYGFQIAVRTMGQIYNTIPVPIGVFYLAYPVMAVPMLIAVLDKIGTIAKSDKTKDLEIHEVLR